MNGTIPRFELFVVGAAVFVFTAGILQLRDSQGPLGFFIPQAYGGQEEIYAQKSYSGDVAPLPTTASHLFLSALVPLDTGGEEQNNGDEVEARVVPSENPPPRFLETAQYTALVASYTPEPSLAPVYKRTEITTYTVKAGDTPSEIARAHQISLSTLLWSNELSASSYIRPGDELFILPIDGLVHAVRSGESVSVLASRYGSTVEKILTYNDIESTAYIFTGQRIIIPDGKQPRVSAPRSYASTYTSLQTLSDYFSRPTSGRISQGLHGYNAVDIAGGCWQPVYAAAAGSVGIASGNGRWNGGYGNFVSVDHPNGIGTLYAHLIQVLSYRGQNVTQGQLLGYTGSTGRSSGCHLHWEVRGARNPLVYY